jgi:EAL domain-containing protein (putative c-di-GMP-specific phosphodiesterase class I)
MRLLVETHLHAAVVRQLASEGVDIETLARWRDGDHRNASDATILEAAAEAGRVLVTYDVHTIPSLVQEWAEAGRDHAGVVFITGSAARLNDVGSLLRGLRTLIREDGDDDWQNRVIYLNP